MMLSELIYKIISRMAIPTIVALLLAMPIMIFVTRKIKRAEKEG